MTKTNDKIVKRWHWEGLVYGGKFRLSRENKNIQWHRIWSENCVLQQASNEHSS